MLNTKTKKKQKYKKTSSSQMKDIEMACAVEFNRFKQSIPLTHSRHFFF